MTPDLLEGWAFRLALPVLGFLVAGLVGALAWVWNRSTTRADATEAKVAALSERVVLIEALAAAARGRDGEHVSREILDLTVKPITDRLDGIEKQMETNNRLMGDFVRAFADSNERRSDRLRPA